ncbi:MAG: pyruvate dehydrogenase E2 component (dihydrolipoamide acetyltransferase) [Pseudomonadales bacterium]
MSIETIKVPDIGGASDVDVIEVNVAVGDMVDVEQTLIVLETDKASMEIPCPQAGKVIAVLVKEGDKIDEGAAIIELETVGTDDAKVAQDDSATTEQDDGATTEQTEIQSEQVQQEQIVEKEPTIDDSHKILLPVIIPDISGATDVDVIEVAVAVGFEVIEGDSLIVLETDKASMEIPAPSAGKVTELQVKEGDKVNEGDSILVLEVMQSSNTPSQPIATTEQKTKTIESTAIAASGSDLVKADVETMTLESSSDVHAGPAVRKIAREFGVELAKVPSSGPKGRVIKEDVQKYVKAALDNPAASGGSAIPPVPAVDFAKFGPIHTEEMSKIAKLTATNMQRSWLNVPHVTQRDEVDISDLEDFRKSIKEETAKDGIKVTPIAFIIKACAVALTRHPKLASSLSADGANIIYKDYIHIGMAVATPAGLVVPVIRDANKKSIYQLSKDIAELAKKAKDRKLMPTDMQGGCFTISSLGNIGGTGFTPIVNTPEVAILGVSKVAIKPVWDGSDFVPRQILPLSLSYDHRVINGVDGGQFMAELNALLGDVRRLVL